MNKLTISLSAIAENYKLLSSKTNCGAVVKANGYGLGAAQVAAKLQEIGCKKFFVALVEEGVELRKTIKDAEIFVFHGVEKNEVKLFEQHNLTPVLNTPAQLANWPKDKPAAAQFDTGMTRLGFKDAAVLKDHNIILIMSHLVAAEDVDSPYNPKQLAEFKEFAKHFPNAEKSLCNSAGIFLGTDYHFDIARPGIALYGGNPTLAKNPMKNVVTLQAPIIQIHEITKPTTVGYNGLYEVQKGDIIGTIPLGYADGIFRNLTNKGKAFARGRELPIVGRISMDLITIKINNLSPAQQKLGEVVEILGENYTICDMAKDAGTIEYEVITRLGNRFERIYI